MTRCVLIVDDDPTIRASLADALIADGTQVLVADSGASALAMMEHAAPDVVLSDVRMDDIDGLALLRTLRERTPNVDIVLMTAYDDMPTVVAAMRDGAAEFLTKPLDLHDVRAVLRRVFEDRRSRRRAKVAAAEEPGVLLEGLVGRTPQMIAIYKLIGHAASTRATVLIRGESGTGKELVARAIHANAADAKEPFVAVNCAALPTTLLESELFGHVRGAFTGAIATQRGRFAQAGRGTIFLDEIGDTSLEFQSKLLRVLQDREFQPVGAERAEKTEARVVAATHQDLEQLATERRFREDLYYRLRVVEIVIPPLRDRPADVPLLADQMMRRASGAIGAAVPVLSAEALEKLTQHTWPGNVRELENCLMRAVVLAGGNVVRPEHLSIASPRRDAGARVAPLDDVEREHVARALAETGGHKTKAAELLGVSRPRLNRLIDKYGLS
jgi:two-component system, NtrC family, response regulator AtoC